MNYNSSLLRWTAFITLTLIATCSPAAEPKLSPGFVSMFNGKTLQGWSVMPAKAKLAWTAENGMIVGDGDKGRSYLVFDNHEIADFEMKLSYRFPGKGNSGINLRAIPDKTGKRLFQGYHVDFGHVGIGKQVLGAWDFHTPGRREHACFRGDRLVIDKDDKPTVTKIAGAVTLDDIHKGGWNDVHVSVKGNRFAFSINGKPSSEFIEHLPRERRLEKGMIQLQLHDPGMIVHFKNLQIKILK
ncbi:MAG: DUF1080 domain-containing protein [Planctomycetota bacterium]|nr:DUF1080 domain-containing protein [Planctomycetota bacterium]